MIESIVVQMGDNKFFFGDKLSTLDLTIYGHLGCLYQMKMSWKHEKGLPYKTFINDYVKWIEMECFGELKYWEDIRMVFLQKSMRFALYK